MTRIIGRVLAVAAAVAVLLSAVAILPSPLDLLLFVALLAIFTAPGWAVARWFGGDGMDGLTRTILALLFGYLIGAVVFCLLRLAGVSSPIVVLLTCVVVAALLGWFLRGPRGGLVPLVRLEPADLIGLAALWLVAAAIVGPVFARVGESTPTGLAYRAYFIADLWAHMSVVGELIKGAAPPMNPYFAGEALPYYWTYFTLPSLFSMLRPGLLIDRGILLTDVGAAVIFLSTAYLVVRNLGASALGTTLSWLTVVLASSFEGAWYLWRQTNAGARVGDFRYFNIDAATRWILNLPGVDGLHRAMWWTPQHETAITLGLVVLLVSVRARRPNSIGRGVFDGLLLGGTVALSSFNGVLLVGWYAVAEVALLALDRGRELWRWVLSRGVAAVIVLGFVGLTMALGMVQRTPDAFIWGWNRYFLHGPWTFILLSFGPALFLAPLGLVRVASRSIRLLVVLGALLTVATVVFLQFDLRGHENTYVTFRTAQLTYLALAALLAFAIDAWRRWARPIAVTLFAVLALSVIVALPTVALDWYNARDISNVEMNPGGFPWTIYISRDDQAAVKWIRRQLPVDVRVQTDAWVRARNTWALIPVFAQRRMATGNGLFELNPSRFEPNLKAIHEIFLGQDADAAYRACRELGIDYLYVGDIERKADEAGLAKFAEPRGQFLTVYRVGSVDIYQVVK